jgi:hypothetical protein
MSKKPVFKSKLHEARWLSEFMGMDVDKISDSEEAMLVFEYMAFIYGEGKLGKPLEAKGGAIGRQIRILSFGDWRTREGLKVAQKIAKETLRDIVALRDGKIDELPVLNVPYRTYVEDDFIWQNTDNEEALLRQSVTDLLCHFPASIIQPCANEYCKNSFVKATKQKKIYCSRKCAWKETARKRRDKQKKGGE